MNINPENPVNILIFNFDEEGHEYNNNYNIKDFLTDVDNKKPNIIFICTQNSKSRTDKHLQHIIGEMLPPYYKRFSKVDATRQSDLKKIMYRNLKNVRTRIYYNTDTVYVNNVFNRFKNQSSTKSIFTLSNNNIDENNQTYNIKETNNNPIIIKEYKYKRYTVEGENGRTGLGGIMTSIVFKMGGLEYQYIVCNFNFNFNNINNIKSKFNKIITRQNIKVDTDFTSMSNLIKGVLSKNSQLKQKSNKTSDIPIFFISFASNDYKKDYKYYKKNNIPNEYLYSKKVLVLCQRKPSKRYPKNYSELKSNEQKINTLVSKLIGNDAEIEYLTNGKDYDNNKKKFDADYKFSLKKNNSNTQRFIKTKKYDMIILYTCPFPTMPYEIIHELLKEGGLIIFMGQSHDQSYIMDCSKYSSSKKYSQKYSELFEKINSNKKNVCIYRKR
jgi:hypothetical protein